MTHIASYPTKKAFKEACMKAYSDKSPIDGQYRGKVYVDDPSLFNPVSGDVANVAKVKGSFTVTNHPKRSWFACVKWVNGALKVE